jgi:hypothetical protein
MLYPKTQQWPQSIYPLVASDCQSFNHIKPSASQEDFQITPPFLKCRNETHLFADMISIFSENGQLDLVKKQKNWIT